jgi:hypothetical protein
VAKFHEAQVHFVDKGRGANGQMALAVQLADRNGVNIPIQMGQKLVIGLLFSARPSLQQG